MARMKILLTQDVPTLGLAGDIRTVAVGYARNYLMPRGYAILATKGAQKQAEEIRQAGVRRRAQERANAEAQAQVISGARLLFQARAGDNDRLYGSVTNAEIADKLAETVGFEIDRRKLQLGQPIRDLGLYDLEIRLVPEVNATFVVGVVREGEDWAAAEARAAVLAAAEAAKAAAAKAEAAAAAADEAIEDADDAVEEAVTETEGE
ncbi:MAG: 50S ribosomal protein L9 [Caldilineaceae bacterium]|nr:50S ribosomal protein L9 [Caldilineaceae bacterium]MCB9147650.1 50S ribosomal protein L9 [Caldilineaceae bacterium]MCB9157155.1 50S ribosomal protein L9 [Caldilineaceae bacterium]